MGYSNGGVTAPGSYGGTATDSPVRMPMVALELDRQAKAVEHLHSLISDLDNRLSGVLRPTTPATGADKKLPDALVPLAGNISETNSRIEAACARLQGIYDRIEL